MLGVAGLLALVMGSALAVVYSTHETRMLFVELEKLDAQRDAQRVEWGRLELEQSAWATHARVDRIARKTLHMTMPNSTDTVYVTP
ncbi:cell division protein FtsL [Acidihalobacter ferrooxydans]|uniref:Cell division protein FtsL n=1 Tax=Acidihalobacter ferrooxydans TaxID=1765967 RepID=A0A1P8UL15_9GAMM|nr:cell division protein FtsL [Acidihalobacter ferrooxydans]